MRPSGAGAHGTTWSGCPGPSKKGFRTFFIGGKPWEARLTSSGIAQFWDCPPVFNEDLVKKQSAYEPGNDRFYFQWREVFFPSVPSSFEILKKCLETVREQHPNQPVVVIHDSLFLADLPFYFGAPLPRGYDGCPKMINFQLSVNPLTCVDLAPFCAGGSQSMPPARNDDDRRRIKALNDKARLGIKGVMEHANQIFKSLGATSEIAVNQQLDPVIVTNEVAVLPYSPSLDYPRPDPHPKTRHIGGLPLKHVDPSFVFPSWWAEIAANTAAEPPSRKKVVMVAQGTVQVEYDELILPTIKALAGRDDILLVATLGKRGAALPEDAVIPANARVTDYLPYDAVLPAADVFVCNAGMGGFMHGVMNGVPMVMAGMAVDKGEVAMRGEWGGSAVNLRTQTPSPEVIREAVDRVLSDGKFKRRALELKEENEELDALGTIEKLVWELAE